MQHVTAKSAKLVPRMLVCLLWATIAQMPDATAAELKQETIGAFDHYVRLTEAGIDTGLASGEPFLWAERLPTDRRAAAESELREGQAVIERIETFDRGKPMECPGGMIHHWIGTVFIPGATLGQVLALVEDYDHHQDYYRPDVMRSKIVRQSGDDFVVEMRFYKKKIITSVVDSTHEIGYTKMDATHARSRSWTTRVQQVENAGKPDERLLPEGHDDGFLWRMNTYWRFEEKDGGTYVECQTISLTRDIPTGLGWLIGPYVTSVPKESLTFTLEMTRRAVLARLGN
ncbi:MAG TPA: hypothetical protein VMH00_17035 [Candidatus Limnocylindrales bacterium]|nr:hypothetical protein [Candidatus Limnocylindrales bacterium]